jgi:hypothetical protein
MFIESSAEQNLEVGQFETLYGVALLTDDFCRVNGAGGRRLRHRGDEFLN